MADWVVLHSQQWVSIFRRRFLPAVVVTVTNNTVSRQCGSLIINSIMNPFAAAADMEIARCHPEYHIAQAIASSSVFDLFSGSSVFKRQEKGRLSPPSDHCSPIRDLAFPQREAVDASIIEKLFNFRRCPPLNENPK